MRNGNRLLAFLVLTTPLSAGAQQPNSDEVAVVRAAVEHYRDVRFNGPIVIDPTRRLSGGPLVAETVVDRVAEETRVTKGKFDEYFRCHDELEGGKKHRICQTRGVAKAVMTFMSLAVRGDTATLTAVFDKSGLEGRLVYVEELLTLVKRAGGTWKVERALETGVS